jgi:membrane-associated phospholipid phosphatase
MVRWIALALNLAMAAATPLSGGHYFVDLVAGAILAVAAIAAASALRNAIEGRVAGRPAAAPAFSRFGSSG